MLDQGHTLDTLTDTVIDRFKDRPHNLKRHLPYRVIRPGNLLRVGDDDHEDDNHGH